MNGHQKTVSGKKQHDPTTRSGGMLEVMRGVRVRTLMGGQREPVSSLAISVTSAAKAQQSNRNCLARCLRYMDAAGMWPSTSQPALS
jgi:hypothetical protein